MDVVPSRSATISLDKSVALAIALAAVGTPTMAHGQAIERNLPPNVGAPITPLGDARIESVEGDSKPIGPALQRLVVLGATDPLASAQTAEPATDLTRAVRLKGRERALTPFLGRPLSMQLIGEVQAALVRQYRAAGFPFVSVTVPAQEITSGVLQLRAVEFRLGQAMVLGASPSDDAYIRSRLRMREGEPIDADALSADLAWLTRFPFRGIAPVLSPGAALGVTDLQLRVTRERPWSTYVGYADSGSPALGWDRYYTGGSAALPPLHDAVASFQVTGSKDAFFDEGRPFTAAGEPAYASAAAQISVPTLPRQAVDLAVDVIRTTQPSQDFSVRQETMEATLDYRSAASSLKSGAPGDLTFGLELRRQLNRVAFGNAPVSGSVFDIFQLLAAYGFQEADALGAGQGMIALHFSPGGVDRRNSDAALLAASSGKVAHADYVYVSGSGSRTINLPPIFGLRGFVLLDSVAAQYAPDALPLTELMGLGANSLVRGYTLDDGAFERAVVSRNELRFPVLAPAVARPFLDSATPYVFVDGGAGRTAATRAYTGAVSAGVAVELHLVRRLFLRCELARAFHTATYTHSGDLRLNTRLEWNF